MKEESDMICFWQDGFSMTVVLINKIAILLLVGTNKSWLCVLGIPDSRHFVEQLGINYCKKTVGDMI